MTVEWRGIEVYSAVVDITDDICREGAEMVARDARALCPVDSGALRDSIRVKKSAFEDGGYMVRAGGKGPWGDAFYAPFVELGTPGRQGVRTGDSARITKRVRRTQDGRDRTFDQAYYKRGRREMTAKESARRQPFLRPALEKNKRRIAQRYDEAMK